VVVTFATSKHIALVFKMGDVNELKKTQHMLWIYIIC